MGILRTDTISGLETPTPVTGSVSFDGTGDYLQTPDSEIFSLEKNDYTIEGWFYFTTLSATQRLFGQRAADASELQMLLETNSSGELTYYFSISSTKNVGGVVATKVNTWHHIAVVRKDLVHTLYVDGVSVATNSTDTGSLDNRAQPFSIGRQGNYTSDAFNGHISNFRICKGTAVYTSNFTVPTHALEVTQDTVLLCCNNPDSAGAEATGKTITVNGDAVASTFSPGLTRDFTYGTQFDGVSRFDTQGYFVPPSGTTEQRGRGRGIFGGGDPGATNNISFIEIQSTGNAQDFGDLTVARLGPGGFSSSTRGVFSNGYPDTNTIDYITISTTSNAVDFGDSTEEKHEPGACSSSTRGVVGGGVGAFPLSQSNVMDYVTIASLGNAQDFGDLTVARRNITSAQSPTRGIFFGGRVDPASVAQNIIDYITIATTGNALDFGDLTTARGRAESVSNTTRAVCIGGENPSTGPSAVTTMEYVTMSSTGNSVNFGTCSSGAKGGKNGASNSIRGVFHSAFTSPANTNNLDYITIAATGNTTDFGDLNYAQMRTTAFSDSHGGLS